MPTLAVPADANARIAMLATMQREYDTLESDAEPVVHPDPKRTASKSIDG